MRRTQLALLGSALGMVPLKGMFTDWSWLVDVWVTMLIVLAPAMVLRRARPAGALDIWPGIILLVPWLTLRFVPGNALGGFIPTAGTTHDVSDLLRDLHDTTANSVAPIHSTLAVKLVLCALLGLLAALIDLIAVVGRRGALAGVPLLVIFTVSGAVPREPVSWVWFVFAAGGFLILLGLNTGDELDSWGRRFRSPRRPATANRWSVTTPRIVVTVVLLAVLAPLAVPGQSRNLIADAFHGGGSGNGLGDFGGGGGGSISPFAALKGQLAQPKPYPMATVHIEGAPAGTQPFYLRSNVLQTYTGDGWQAAGHGDEEPIDDTQYNTEPDAAPLTGDSVQMRARITITGITGNAPVFAIPSAVSGLDPDTTWAPQDQILLGSKVSRGDSYEEDFRQPTPTAAQLGAATSSPSSRYNDINENLALPGPLPPYAQNLVDSLTRNKSSPYAQARAINSYFTDPGNGFVYDLKTGTGDSGSALVDFLINKHGYCQQFAAAMGVMLRAAHIPSRVVLGYMHPATDSSGTFTVTSADAHAWVEAYFTGIGWIPFDPTPSSGLAGGSSTDLAWAPHPQGQSGGTDVIPKTGPKASTTPTTSPTGSATSAGTAPRASRAAQSASISLVPLWWGLCALALLTLVLIPAAVRGARRRRRHLRARRDGDADALWSELSDTATDLGYVWSSARTPRQVAGWLERDLSTSAGSLRDLAAAVEQGRYAPAGTRSPSAATLNGTLGRGLRGVTAELRAGRSSGTRVRSRLWPASLGWNRPRRRGDRKRR